MNNKPSIAQTVEDYITKIQKTPKLRKMIFDDTPTLEEFEAMPKTKKAIIKLILQTKQTNENLIGTFLGIMKEGSMPFSQAATDACETYRYHAERLTIMRLLRYLSIPIPGGPAERCNYYLYAMIDVQSSLLERLEKLYLEKLGQESAESKEPSPMMIELLKVLKS